MDFWVKSLQIIIDGPSVRYYYYPISRLHIVYTYILLTANNLIRIVLTLATNYTAPVFGEW